MTTDTATTANMDPLVMSTTTAISGNRDATPPIPGGARTLVAAVAAALIVAILPAIGVELTEVQRAGLVAFLLGIFDFGRKAWANARVEHGK